ncbi:hypothetical protein HK098_000044 [Nowakowskiella sp. JEL0407]|nr:hypothetical protein HK098_000044 [Nowakowskiella sp. JEL0407]
MDAGGVESTVENTESPDVVILSETPVDVITSETPAEIPVESLDVSANEVAEIPEPEVPEPAEIVPAITTAADDLIDDDDDFGDFDDFTVAESTVEFQIPTADTSSFENDEKFNNTLAVLSNDNSGAQSILDSVSTLLSSTFFSPPPISDLISPNLEDLIIEDYPSSNENSNYYSKSATEAGKMIFPNPYYANEKWVKLWDVLARDELQNGVSKFRWKKSEIRKLFLETLDVVIIDEKPPQKPAANSSVPTPSLSTDQMGSSQTLSKAAAVLSDLEKSGNGDSRDEEIKTAKALCEISEDELRKKTAEELQDIVRQLLTISTKLHQQSNYWLDAKEQLLMDAEMHNKMIASLVQYAQQLQVQVPNKGKGKRTKSPGKKGKR